MYISTSSDRVELDIESIGGTAEMNYYGLQIVKSHNEICKYFQKLYDASPTAQKVILWEPDYLCSPWSGVCDGEL